MNLFNAISQRKACRKYVIEPLSVKQLEEIKLILNSFDLLFPEAVLNYRFVSETKGVFHVEAPHYLIISGHGKDGEQENAGFVGQTLTLWLNERGLGSVWLGGSKDATTMRKSTDIIVIAFGQPDASPYRELSEFKRKPILEITNDPDDKCLQAVRLAPSGMNLQPWYFKKTSDKILVYRQILKPPISLAYKLTKIDIGIALSHYAIACKHYKKPFLFYKNGNAQVKKGYEFFGYLDIAE